MATPHLPTGTELTRLYSRAEARACLGWSDEKLRRRLIELPHVRPSGSGRGQQFTGTDIVALYQGGVTRRQELRGAPASAGASAGTEHPAGRSMGGPRRVFRVRELLRELDSDIHHGASEDADTIIVRVELEDAVTGRAIELARARIRNVSGTGERGTYEATILRGRSTEELDRCIQERTGTVTDHPGLTLHVWHLVAKALAGMGYGK